MTMDCHKYAQHQSRISTVASEAKSTIQPKARTSGWIRESIAIKGSFVALLRFLTDSPTKPVRLNERDEPDMPLLRRKTMRK
ncbi:hypothetical protein DBV15_09909 [Temnothorax longispinosus]|uniref:Uncharacterized protein n=1 Tax=Temnothorax longispinosus TaxID=300112 RepID=A0A4S2KFG4_9HYME|nr:hypothetical protein DBV15_09909 [Temnothorax longispinosus]